MEALTPCSFLPKPTPLTIVSCVSNGEENSLPTKTQLFTPHQLGKSLNSLKKSIINSQETAVATNRTQKWLHNIFKSLEDFICTFIDLPLGPSIDPIHVLSGNLAPVENELPPTPCQVVEGSLPSCLDGAYIRNGPNPQFAPRGPYHLFDGDGMLHMIKISGGKATFCSRYVKTYKYLMEREIGHPFFLCVFSSFNGFEASMARLTLSLTRVLTGQFNPVTHGFGTANTSLALFNKRLFALCESDLPYEVNVTSDGDIITIGRHDFQSDKPFFRMTAHPKIDHDTGEAFTFRFNMMTRPFLTFFRIGSNGRKQPDVHISSVEKLTLIHDFAVTNNYVVFPDTQIVVEPKEIMRGRPPMRVDRDKVPRIGIIPRYAEDETELSWIDVPGFNMMHLVNAWEEEGGDIIEMVASNVLTIDLFMERIDMAKFSLEKVKINVKAKTVERESLSAKFLEMGVINPAYAAKSNRYVYAAVMNSIPRGEGVVKLDLSLSAAGRQSDSVVASRLYAPGCCGGEPFFVPREPNNPEAEEDDGYIVTYVHDENSKESKFLVMDAKSTSLETVAVVKLPQRVPLGFHGLFVSQIDLNKLTMNAF